MSWNGVCQLNSFSHCLKMGFQARDATKFTVPSLASSKFLGFPQRSSITRLRSADFRSCSFFNSSAAFLRRRSRSFFLRSGVMNPFFPFLAAASSANRARTSAFFKSIAACFFLRSFKVTSRQSQFYESKFKHYKLLKRQEIIDITG